MAAFTASAVHTMPMEKINNAHSVRETCSSAPAMTTSNVAARWMRALHSSLRRLNTPRAAQRKLSNLDRHEAFREPGGIASEWLRVRAPAPSAWRRAGRASCAPCRLRHDSRLCADSVPEDFSRDAFRRRRFQAWRRRERNGWRGVSSGGENSGEVRLAKRFVKARDRSSARWEFHAPRFPPTPAIAARVSAKTIRTCSRSWDFPIRGSH